MKLGIYLGQVNKSPALNGKNQYTRCALLRRRLQVYETSWAFGCLNDMRNDYEYRIAFTSVSAC